jgi:filamentous hemagglutinin family protein
LLARLSSFGTGAPARLKHPALRTRFAGLLLASTALSAVGWSEAHAVTLPTGGQVAAGQASIAKTSPSTLTIDQTSSKAIVNWSGFSIGQGGTVRFDNGSGATLNRVTGTNISSIDGLLSATGSVYLINPNGVIIGKDGVVSTGGTFVASTQDLTNAEFMTGGTLTFSGASTASVLNLGKVGSLGGDVALIAAKVENDGTITASKGDVGLAAGFQVTMSDATQNDGKFQVLVGGAGTSATNTGSIQAAEAELRANGGNVYALAGNTGGVIEATGVSNTDGKVLLIAEDGTVTANNTIKATGEVETSGQSVNFAGLTVKAPNWLIDPEDLTISGADAATLSGILNGDTSVTLETTSTTPAETGVTGLGTTSSGAGDITIASAVSWASAATLTLDAYHSINIDAPITTNGGGVVLNTNYNNTGGGGDYGFGLTAAGFQGSLTFTGGAGSGESLNINGTSYTLEYSPAALVTAINYDGPGNFALAQSGSLGSYNTSPIIALSGNFTGLGHTISGLTIAVPGFTGGVGFVKYLGGTVRDIGLVGGSVTAASADYVGALVGESSGTITDAYATSAVSGGYGVGGLVGQQQSGSISDAYATGAVSGPEAVGGLVGEQDSASIADAYATGAVGNGSELGGLVGYQGGGSITDAYATGAVSGTQYVGGLVGQSGGAITDAYATGAVSGTLDVGGLVGIHAGSAITDGYWDTSTSGKSSGVGSGPSGGVTGEATANLQGALPTFQNAALWSSGPGLYPYLTNFFPNGVQAVSGVAYAGSGVTPLSGNTVTLDVNGASLNESSGANGYYYFAEQPGTISASGSPVLIYSSGPDAGARLQTLTGATGGLDLWGQTFIAPTADTTLSSASATTLQVQDAALLASAEGSDSTAATVVAGLTNYGYLATGASFTLDTPLTLSNGLYAATTASGAPITVAAALTLPGAEGLNLQANGALAIDAPITVSGAGAVTLAAGLGGTGDYNFGLTAAGFQGSLSFTNAEGGGQSLSIDGSPYTLVYSMSELASDLNNSSGDFALAAPLNAAGTTYPSAVVASFNGAFTGLGNTITGLTINDASTNGDDGLFGQQTAGEIRDVGLVGGSVSASGGYAVGDLVAMQWSGLITDAYATGKVSGNSSVGGLVGGNAGGSITDAYATGAVSGPTDVGGLIGENNGSITDSYATGAVSGTYYVGGLAGEQGAGSITDAYATGAVSAVGSGGGLVGIQEAGSISDAYATGAVAGAGGLVGYQIGGAISDGYYDASTTGQALGSQGNGSVGMTTAALQGTLPAFANGGPWSTGPGLYPYLTNFFPHGVRAISGVAYGDSGVTPLAGDTITLDVNGASLGNASSGANGYYYFAEQAGTISSGGSPVLIYSSGPNAGARLQILTGTTGGLDIWGQTFIAPTNQTTLSTASATPLQVQDAAWLTGAEGSDGAASTLVAGLTNYGYVAIGAGFTLDTPQTLSNGLYVETTASGAPITVAAALTLPGAEGLNLQANGALAIDAPITIAGAGAVTLAAGLGGTGDYNFGLTGGGFLGSLNFTNTEGGGQSLTIDGSPYTLVYSMSELASDLNGSSGNFALASSQDASSDSFSSAVVASFGGTFTGLGHTITGLVINDPSNNGDDGLFGHQSAGAIRDIGLVAGSVSTSEGDDVGDLVGRQTAGFIADAYATGAVTGNNSVGGLVGESYGAITDAYATGTVSGSLSVGGLAGGQYAGTITDAYATGAVDGTLDVGGLVGTQDGGGTITDAYATGSALNGGADVGGLVGEQYAGSITDAYATGAVSGSHHVGGLVGYNGGSIADGYYDASTTGQPLGSQLDGSVGLTTAALQGALPAFQNIGLWSTGPGLYPYLTNFFPNGVQAVSGFSYSDGGSTPAAAWTSVSAIAGGTAFGQAGVGANGYYYIFAPAGGITSGQSVLAYDASTDSATLTTATSAAAQGGVNLYGGAMTVPTAALLLSTAPTLTQAQASGLAADGGIGAAATVIGETTALGLVASGAGFTLDVAPSTSLLVKTTAGAITVAAPFTLAGSNYLTLDSFQGIAIDAPITVSGAGAVSLVTNDGGSGGDYGFGLTAAGFQGGLSFTNTEGGGQSLTIDGSPYTLVYSMSELASELDGSSGNFALAAPLNAAGTTYPGAVVALFGGTFTGLGHTISGLTVNDTGGGLEVGLFGGQTGGEIRDVGLVGGSVTAPGAADVGDLVGYQSGGLISDVYVTGAVSGTGVVGDLVGQQYGGSIAGAYATGAVSGTAVVGGLVGEQDGGSITDAYATGAVTGSEYVGGLLGYMITGSITDAYATGAVSGGEYVGGLLGLMITGSITDADATGAVSGNSGVGGLVGAGGSGITDGYYDASTTGRALGTQADGSIGMTTAALQSALPTFLNPVWSTGGGLYPYLTNFFPNGAQAVSGFAYSDAGATPLASSGSGAVSVAAMANGVSLGSATTGANGYYYILTAAGGVPGGGSVLAYGNDAATLATSTGAANTGGVDLYGDARSGTTSATTYSAAISGLTTAMTAAANGNSAALAAIDGATGADLTATGASFTLNQAVTTSGALSVTTTAANAPITVAQGITINGAGDLALDAAGNLAVDAPIDVTDAGAVSLASGGGYGFGLSGSGFLGSLTFTGGQASGASLKINGSAYTLIYSMSALASDLNGATGDYALATTLGSGGHTGAVVGSFGGTFTGLGNYITDLTITGSTNETGLFGELSAGGEIRDIGLVGGSVSGGSKVGALAGIAEGLVLDAYATTGVSGTSDVGGLVGYVSGAGVLSDDVTAGGTISGTLVVGGLVGKNLGAIEAGAASSDTVLGNEEVGGLAGYSTGAITGAAATGQVTGSGSAQLHIGGLAGFNSGTISASRATGAAVSGLKDVGGLVGQNIGTLEGGASSSDTVSGNRYVGGLAGDNTGAITAASATGAVTGTGSAPLDLGGLVGENGASGVITASQATGAGVSAAGGVNLGGLVGTNEGQIGQSFATEAVSSDGTGERLGGLVGYNFAGSTITDTYATGQVGAGAYIGGLVGDNAGAVDTSWADGQVAAGANSGGVAGAEKPGASLTHVFWDIGTTGLANAVGKVNHGSSANVTGVGGSTGANPDRLATYTGFNFTSIWTINPGTSRPYLRNVTPQKPPN